MARAKLSCEERNRILNATGRYDGWTIESSLTDLSGEFGDPRIETVWVKDGRRIRDVRHPAERQDDVREAQPDRLPCEHYELDKEAE